MGKTAEKLIEIFLKENDPHDPWGSCMEWFFTIAHLIHHKYGPEFVPSKWKYQCSIMETSLDTEEYHLIPTHRLEKYPMKELRSFGNYLEKLAEKLKAEHKDY